MPPQISDDEASDVSEREVPVKSDKKPKLKPAKEEPAVEEEESLMVESEDNAGEDEDEEIGEDEYVVESITNHLVDEDTGELRFEVKWEGYEKKSDRTWEPEENLFSTAEKILNEYLASVGGKDQIMLDWEEKKKEAGAKKGPKKRGRASTGTPQANGSAKRGRKGDHPASATPPASVKDFKPPSGSWEEDVVGIDACEGTEGNVVVYLTWKNGHKTQHPLPQVYKRCPQKMLKFYESHLVFKQHDEMA